MIFSPRPRVYDVCIVGSGAGGGMAAYVLTRAGADVVLLEAGAHWDNDRDSAMLQWPYASPRRGAATKERPFGEFDACVGGWEIEGEPYTRGPGTTFDWWRARMLGGRTNHWGRISLRFGPDDFRRKSLDRLGDDWPIGPAKAPPELSQGVAFFNALRDLTAAGFWSSKLGVADLEYRGNTGMAEWSGCPPEALHKLGVSYGPSEPK